MTEIGNSEAGKAFLAKLGGADGGIFVDPAQLYPVRECSDRGTATIVEEARLYPSAKDVPGHPFGDFLLESISDTLEESGEPNWRQVIVKTYRPHFVGTPEEMDALVTDVKKLYKLDHENMVGILGMGCFSMATAREIRESVYVVEEFGGLWSLFKMLRSRKLHRNHPHVQLSVGDCLRWCINIADALAYLHTKGVVHRDLKPENIWLTDEDVHECVARVGDLKPHRRNFRKFAAGHTRMTKLAPDSPSPSPSISMLSQTGMLARQKSLSQHRSMRSEPLPMLMLDPVRSNSDVSTCPSGLPSQPGSPLAAGSYVLGSPADSPRGSRRMSRLGVATYQDQPPVSSPANIQCGSFGRRVSLLPDVGTIQEEQVPPLATAGSSKEETSPAKVDAAAHKAEVRREIRMNTTYNNEAVPMRLAAASCSSTSIESRDFAKEVVAVQLAIKKSASLRASAKPGDAINEAITEVELKEKLAAMLASRPRESIESISLAAERLASASVGEEGEGGTLRARFADDDTGGPGGDSTSTEPEDGGGDTATEASLVDKPSNGMRSADGSADGADGPVGGSERAGPEGAGAAAAKPKTGGARFTDEPAEGDAASKAPTTSKPKGARFADDPADVGGDTKAAKPKKGGARFADDPVADVVGGPESSSASKGPDGTGAASAAAKPVKKGARFADDPPESAADGGAANAGADKAPDGAGAAVAAKPAKKGARFADDPPESASSCATDATAATATGVADAAATSSTTTSSLYLRPHPPNIKIPGSAGPAEIPDELVSQPSSIADVAGRPPSESRMSPFARVGVQGAGVADPSETPLTRQLRQLSESDNLAAANAQAHRHASVGSSFENAGGARPSTSGGSASGATGPPGPKKAARFLETDPLLFGGELTDGVIGSPKPLARIQSFQVPLLSSRSSGGHESLARFARVSMGEKAKKEVTFRTGVPDGLAPTEDYSLVYAAPEYILNMNCDTLAELGPAADVFSFGKIIFEILTQSLINPSLEVGDAEGWHTTSATLAAYAQKVSSGYREKIPDAWPDRVRELVSACWAQDADKRPKMEEVARRLRELAADANVHILLEPPPLPPESESEEEEQQPRPKRQATGRRPAGHIDDLNDDFDDDYDDEKDEGGAEAEAESDAREGSLDRPSRTHRSSRPSIERPSNTYYPPPTPVARRAKPEEGKDGCCIVS